VKKTPDYQVTCLKNSRTDEEKGAPCKKGERRKKEEADLRSREQAKMGRHLLLRTRALSEAGICRKKIRK